MGGGMAASIIRAGLPLRVWNRSPGKAAPLADRGAFVAADPAEAVRGADLVVTMVWDEDSVVAAKGLGLRLPFVEVAQAQLRQVSEAGHQDQDMAAVYLARRVEGAAPLRTSAQGVSSPGAAGPVLPRGENVGTESR